MLSALIFNEPLLINKEDGFEIVYYITQEKQRTYVCEYKITLKLISHSKA